MTGSNDFGHEVFVSKATTSSKKHAPYLVVPAWSLAKPADYTANEKPRHIPGIFKKTWICQQYVGNWLIQHSSWLIQLKRHSNEYATNISGGVASIATNTYLICQNRTTIANIFSLPCIIHREAEFKSFSSLLGFCAAWSFASGKRSFDRIQGDYQVRTWHQIDISAKPPNLWMLHVAGSCNTNNNKLFAKYIAKFTMAIVDRWA